MRDQKEHLRDILDVIESIQRYSTRGREAFEQDELIHVWMVHHLQIIGEAAAQLGRDFHVTHTKAPWPQIVTMRYILVHEYFGVDLDEVWQVMILMETPSLGYLRNICQALMKSRGGE